MCSHTFYDRYMTKNHGDHWLREMLLIILYQIYPFSCALQLYSLLTPLPQTCSEH